MRRRTWFPLVVLVDGRSGHVPVEIAWLAVPGRGLRHYLLQTPLAAQIISGIDAIGHS